MKDEVKAEGAQAQFDDLLVMLAKPKLSGCVTEMRLINGWTYLTIRIYTDSSKEAVRRLHLGDINLDQGESV